MKRTTILLSLLLWTGIIFAENKEPCKGVLLPAELHSAKIIFEMPTYDEYVQSIVKQSFIKGITVDDSHILDELIFNKVRKAQIKAIKATYLGEYEMKTSEEVKRLKEGFVFTQSFITPLVSSHSTKFEEYTKFSIKNLSNASEYTLVNPAKDASANCIVKKGDYKFDDLVESIQK